jgi:KDO2-lipid IV(A) lauroyltransferase
MTVRLEGVAPRWHQRGLNNAAIVGATYYGVSWLPAWMSCGIGHVGAWLAYHLMRQGTDGLLQNLGIMFPEYTAREREAIALLTYRSYARDVIDFIRSLSMTPEATRGLVSRVDMTALEEAMAGGRGAVVLSGHFGNWEIGGVLLRRLTPYAMSVVVKAEPSQAVTRLRETFRSSMGVETIEVRQHLETALKIRERLRGNQVVAMLLDRHLGKDQVEVSFFGRPTRFLRSPALIAALSGAPIVPCFVYRDRDGLVVECGPIIRVPSTGDLDEHVEDATQKVATLIEAHSRRAPHYWYQFYPFWSDDAAVPSKNDRA